MSSRTADRRRRTTRGLTSVPPTKKHPVDETVRVGVKNRRRKIKESMFSLGVGLDMPLLILILVILSIGLVMLFSSSYAFAYTNMADSYSFIRRQGIIAVLGVAAMLFISTFNYHNFHKLSMPLFIVTIVLLVMVLAFKGTPIAPVKGGANRWLKIGMEFQPSEIAKFALVVMLAHILSKAGENAGSFKKGFLPCAICLGIICILVVAEKHVSATLIIIMISAAVMIIGGVSIKYFAAIAAPAAAGLAALILFTDKFSYALVRIKGWLDPFNPPEGIDTYQTRQSLYAIGSGGVLGAGLGQSKQKYLYLPEPQNDFIFAIVCEELGFIGALLIILLFAMLIWRGVYVSLHAKDRFGTLMGLGITFTVGLQAVLNICVVTNALPNTGISLPFFSAGGTSLMVLLGEMGVLLAISRSSYVEKT